MTPVLELDDVTFRREGKQIIDGISLTVQEGEHWAFSVPTAPARARCWGSAAR
ncbi:ATP-binding cassette domain-containing protein [Mycolicibacterium aubagnense]